MRLGNCRWVCWVGGGMGFANVHYGRYLFGDVVSGRQFYTNGTQLSFLRINVIF